MDLLFARSAPFLCQVYFNFNESWDLPPEWESKRREVHSCDVCHVPSRAKMEKTIASLFLDGASACVGRIYTLPPRLVNSAVVISKTVLNRYLLTLISL